ncbi:MULTISPECIES: alpha/beta fold hydrolase [Hyphobacterium]|uniref:Alpha/beta fold hydrolase n=1 Tax=Hyphobacterium vulgare TaxID=1736751 RepID=A0ABV6ZW96_9PROT
MSRARAIEGRIEGPEGAPAVLVLGGISSGKNLTGAGGWWPGVAGPGGALDPACHRLISADFLDTGEAGFPSAGEQAKAILGLIAGWEIGRFHIVGASYGGSIGLAISLAAPERVSGVTCISAAHRADPLATAWRSIQREIAEFGLKHGNGPGALDLARRLAMTTYRTRDELRLRFLDPAPGTRDARGITAWLEAAGAKYAAKTAPEHFLALSRALDAVDLDPSRIKVPVHYVAVEDDLLVPLTDMEEAASLTPDSRLTVIRSIYGHDAFLKEVEVMNALISADLERPS